MNILFLDNHKVENIFSKLNFYFLQNLSKKKHINVISITNPNYNGMLNTLNIPLYSAALKSKTDFNSISTIRKIIKTHKIDIIQCQNNRALANAILSTYFLKDKPKIICRRGIIRKIKRLDPIEWITYLNPRYTHTIALTNAIRKDLIENSKFNEKDITTIYQAFDLKWLDINYQFDTKKTLNIPNDATIVGTVANFRPIKGLDIFIQAINTLTRYKNIHYIFIGENCKKNLQKLISDESLNSRVHFLEYQKTPGNYVKDFDIYIQPSRSEGLGFALLEAMLLEICPIVSKVGGMKELVIDNKTGLTFDPLDDKSFLKLAEKIIYLYENKNLKKELANNAKKFTEKEFSLETMMDKHLKLYKKIMAN